MIFTDNVVHSFQYELTLSRNESKDIFKNYFKHSSQTPHSDISSRSWQTQDCTHISTFTQLTVKIE